MRWRAPLVIAVALTLASCGTASPTAVAFRTRAARVCTQAIAAGARLRPPASASDTAAFLRRGTAVVRPELASLRALRPPAAEAATYSAALRADERELSVLDATLHELDQGADPLSAIKTLQHRLAALEANDVAAWRTLDVPACARE